MFRAISLALAQLSQPAMIRLLIKVALITLAFFIGLGIGVYFALAQVVPLYADPDALHDGYYVVFSALITILLAWFGFRIIAIAVLQFYGDEIVGLVERTHYPEAFARVRKLGLATELRLAMAGLGRTILAHIVALPFIVLSLFTVLGPAVILGLLNAWLLGRELILMVTVRYDDSGVPDDGNGAGRMAAATGQPGANGLAPPRWQQHGLGLIIALLFLVPVLNILAPVIGAAMATHLVHGRKQAALVSENGEQKP